MCFDFVEQSLECLRGIICCICCMILIGPILLIVGVTMLSSKNHYEEYVNKYNSAVVIYNDDYKSIMQAGSGVVYQGGGSTTTPMSSQSFSSTAPYSYATLPTTSTQGVKYAATSIAISSNSDVMLPPFGSGSTIYADLTSAKGNRSTRFNIPAPIQSTKRKSVYCDSSDKRNRRYCRDLCNNVAPSGCSATYTGSYGSYCQYSSSCSGHCQWTESQTSYCATVSASNTSGFSTGSKTSCIYPFGSTNQKKTCSGSTPSTSQKVYFISDKDPFVALQSVVSDSDGSFGLTASQQRNIGLALIGVGGAITGLMVFVCIAIFKKVNGDERNKEKVYLAFGRSYQPNVPAQNYYAASPNNNVQFQQPANNVQFQQQQPGYAPAGAPQPGYAPQGAPQPYMEQQPGYSAQPPMMQQQPVGYAPQQPGYAPQPGAVMPPPQQGYGAPQQTYGAPSY